MERLLENKVCIIIGAAQGIGKGIAERFAADGASSMPATCVKAVWMNGPMPQVGYGAAEDEADGSATVTDYLVCVR